jgi:haloacetate dehalogenase
VFDGFTLERVDLGEVTLRVRHGGAGPAVLLLHGHPRTHVTWHRVAPHSKRAMAADCLALMRHLGHERFAVVGHDRGAYVALRTVLDHPAAVTALAVLDAVPIGEALARCDARFAAAWWHWFFYGQTAKRAERVISADPDAWYTAGPEHMGAEAWADYRQAIHDPATVEAMMEDYRAGLGVDRRHDDEDRRAGRRVACPTLVLWATEDDLGELYGDVLAVWRPWAADLRGHAFPSGHHMAEEAPDALAAELAAFLA